MSKHNETNWYANVFKNWNGKALGPKPTAEMLASIHGLGARPGKQALAISMGLRDCGVTGSQIVIACGAPQLNKMRGFIADALLKRVPVAPSGEGHTVYKLELTPKGNKRIEATKAKLAAAEAAGKAEGGDKPKGKKAAGKAAGKPKGKGKAKAEAEAATAETATGEAASAATLPPVEPVTETAQAAE